MDFKSKKSLRWQAVDKILDEVVDVSPSKQREILQRSCGDDVSLRREVEKLLSNLETAPDFMEVPAVNSALTLLNDERGEKLIGQNIGPYRLLKLIGQGGMGTVYLASRIDEAYRKEVAIKIVPPILHNVETERSFRRERQILAKLEHPNIARLIDGGTTAENIPYLVMEFVEGEAITEFSSKKNLSIRDCLLLFLKVCEAVKFAHQNLIIHRDLKPNNIFVTNEGEVKLLDFGIAKLLRPELLDVTGDLSYGANVLTPNYSSPEQLRDENITTASDVYSLGVILYELLTEHRPHDLKQKSLPEILRIISQENPTKPSRHVSSLDGDLDTICGKALAKEVIERYQTVDELSTDISRYLNNLPILARQPSSIYHLRKYVVRNKIAVSTVGLILIILVGWLATTIFQRNSARRQASQNLELAYSADMNSASFAWKTANLTRLKELLDRYTPKGAGDTDLRGFEWRFLDNLLQNKAKVLSISYDKDVWTTAFSPDGSRFATGCAEGFARIYETSTGKLLATTQIQEKNIWRVKFSPDGKFIGTASGDLGSKSVRIWNTETGAEHLNLVGHTDRVRSIDFSPDGKFIATGSRDKTVKIWSFTDGKLLRTIDITAENTAETHDLAFLPDSKKLAVLNSGLLVFDVAGGKEIFKKPGVEGSFALAVSPDGKSICVGKKNGELVLFDAVGGNIIWQVAAHMSQINDVEFSADGETIATASSDRTVKFFQSVNGQEIRVLKAHLSEVWSVSFSPKGDYVITSSTDFQAHLWRRDLLLDQHSISYPQARMESDVSAISPDGKIIVLNAAGSLSAISAWNLSSKQMIYKADTTFSQVTSIAFDPSGRTMAIGGRNGELAIIATETGTQLQSFQADNKRVSQIAFAPDGETFLTASDDNSAKLWQTRDLAEIHRFDHANAISAIGFTEGGRSIFVASHDYTAQLWNAESFAKIAEIGGHSKPILSFADEPTGNMFATGGADGLINIWNSKTGELLQTLSGNAGHVTALTFTSDATRLASASTDSVIRLWKLNTIDRVPQQVLSIDAPGPITNFIRFSPDENLLVTSGISQKANLWFATPK